MIDTGTIHHFGPWQIPYKATGVVFPDGKRRTVKLHHTPDTFWTIPARVSYRGTTVSGFVMHDGMDTDEKENLRFYPTGKNADLFEERR
jgi:hypothetical protein